MSKSTLIKSVDRAICILDALADAGPNGMPLGALSDELDINASTLHHLLATLKERQMVAQDPLTKHYRLGVHLIKLGSAALEISSLAQVAHEYLEEVGKQTGHGVSLLVFHGLLRTPLTDVTSRQPLTAKSAPLEISTLHATGSGKLLLAYLPDRELDQYLTQTRLERFTADTITDRETLLEELARIREQGVSIDRGEHGSSIWCVAGPVQDASRKVVGCLDSAFPAWGLTADDLSETVAIIRGAAEGLSGRLAEIGFVAN
jgi:IclR family acetate operon transcriptional repressor